MITSEIYHFAAIACFRAVHLKREAPSILSSPRERNAQTTLPTNPLRQTAGNGPLAARQVQDGHIPVFHSGAPQTHLSRNGRVGCNPLRTDAQSRLTAASVQETHSATPERIETTLGGCFGVRDTRSRRRHTDADFPSKSRGKTHFIRVVHLTRWRAVSAISGPSHPRHTHLSVTRIKSPLAQNPAYIGPHPQS